MKTNSIHIPVLSKEVIELLCPPLENGELFVDATLGAGGHTKELMQKSEIRNQNIRVIGFDQDEEILKIANENLKEFKNIEYIHDNFRNIRDYIKPNTANAILADIGVSSYQFDNAERGFSFNKDAPLDMRMDKNSNITAELIIKTWNSQKLEKLFKEYGEEKFAYRISKAIAEKRRQINSTRDLAQLVEETVPTSFKRRGIHLATLIFQALRIAVNDEIEALREFLEDAPDLLVSGGRLAVISFQSLEDRLVKNKFRQLDKQKYKLLTKSPITAQSEEVAQNPRSRSAKLRVIERL